MPYAKRQTSDHKWEVYNKDSGKVEGHTTSEAEAQKMIEAIDANSEPEGGKAHVGLDSLVYFGGGVKALDDASRKIGGWLVEFGTPETADTQGDYFTEGTAVGSANKATIRFHHGFDPDLGICPIGEVEFTRKAEGIWCEGMIGIKAADCEQWAAGILARREAYETKIYEMVKAGKLGWSSAALPHLVRKRAVKAGITEVTSWPIGDDATLSPTPVDHRNVALPLKALLGPHDPAVKGATEDGAALAQSRYESQPEPPMPAHHRALHAALDELHGMHRLAVKGHVEDTSKAPAERTKSIGRCHDEYRTMALKACKAMLADDGEHSKADADDEGAAIKALTDEFARRLAASPALADDLRSLATEAEELGRTFKAHADHRQGDGRHVSPVKRAALGDLIGSLKATLADLEGHHAATAPRPDPARLRAARLAALRQQHELDALLLG